MKLEFNGKFKLGEIEVDGEVAEVTLNKDADLEVRLSSCDIDGEHKKLLDLLGKKLKVTIEVVEDKKDEKDVIITYQRRGLNMFYDVKKDNFGENITNEEAVRVLKTIFKTKKEFKAEFIDVINDIPRGGYSEYECSDAMYNLLMIYSKVTPLTKKEKESEKFQLYFNESFA